MPNWVMPLLVLIVLVGFVGFAFRQGMKVTPDYENRDHLPPGGGSIAGSG
jgi:hypothetical protein